MRKHNQTHVSPVKMQIKSNPVMLWQNAIICITISHNDIFLQRWPLWGAIKYILLKQNYIILNISMA